MRSLRSVTMYTLLFGASGLGFAVASASCGSNNTVIEYVDGGSTEGGPVDSGTKPKPDAGDASNECDLPDGGSLPQGTQIVASQTVIVDGVTGDGFAVFTDTSASMLNAAPIAGGAPMVIGADDGSGIDILGATVFSWTGATQTQGLEFGALTTWSSTKGAKKVATASLSVSNEIPGLYDVSADGANILYFDNATNSGQMADLYAAASDGTGAVKLIAGIQITQQCIPHVGFAGAYAVAAFCTAAPGADAGTNPPVATLTTWTGAAWGTVATASDFATTGWSLDTSKAHLTYVSSTGLQYYDIASNTSTPIDANGTAGVFTSDGQNLIYTATDGSIMRSPVAAAAPVVVLAASTPAYQGILTLSSNDAYLVTYKTVDQTSGNIDLYLSPTAANSTAVTLSTATTANLFGDAFTADNTHAIYYTNLDTNDVGDLDVLGVTAATPAKIGSAAWESFTSSGANVIYNDNWTSGAASGTADLKTLDSSNASATPKLLATGADANFFISKDKKSIVYSWTFCSNGQSGVYAAPAP